METILLACMTAAVAAVAALILVGGRGIRSVRHGGEALYGGDDLPPVSVIMPVKGSGNGMCDCLTSVVRQDYPDHEIIFVTESGEEPAAEVIREVISRCEDAAIKHVIAGTGRGAGQKNHNLLAGIRAARPDAQVYVTCDSSNTAPPHWLRALVAPVAAGECDVASGYHHMSVEDASLSGTGHAVLVLAMYLLQSLPGFAPQPWGGNTAISAEAFRRLDIAEMWESTVVDDVTLGYHLFRSKAKFRVIPAACLFSPIRIHDLDGWCNWLTRQWLYLKFVFPGSWVALGIALGAIFLLTAAAVLHAGLAAGLLVLSPFVSGAAEALSAPALGYGPLFLAALTALGAVLREHHPAGGSLHRWLIGFFAVIPMAFAAHVRTWGARNIMWRGIGYHVGRGGRVLKVFR